LRRCAVVNALQKRWTRGLHLSEILDMLNVTKLDLKERRVVIDVERLELPENNGGIFGSELLVLRALLEIRCDGFSNGFMRDSNSGCGRQNNEAEWPTLRARRNAIHLI
jgi:hypothetical protein